ncbi:HET-domain-containing protein [Hypoxylon rubiginosum]|uniref:HET-domain-containing protein n=1 Tax=Hypoxylon rubiginosum TaxID=110542 RepID=A0ACB9YTB9_9PEZI|nr:HET-domain-containing protein [Hypoxylon rubiginosum]
MEFLNRFSTRFQTPPKADNYVYTPMEQADRQIRLVTICPGTWSDKIKCEVHVASMDDSPYYEALSYVWGDANKTKPISVDDQIFPVTENLYFALRRLRYTESPRVIWIDAICINQKDNEEKSTQVGMMGRIYSNCQKAILWLGEDPRSLRVPRRSSPPQSVTARRAFRMLRILGQDKHINELPCFLAKRSTRDEAYPRLRAHPCFRHHFKSLIAMTHLPWWTRIWVAQETVLPNRVEFAFASETCQYEVFDNFLRYFSGHANSCCTPWLQELYDQYLPVQALIGDVGALVSVRQSLVEGAKFTLLELRSTFWTSEATDQRDLIYALLGLANNWGDDMQPLKPNYSLPYAKVVCEVFFRCVRQTKDLQALRGYRWLPDTGLPSWIPDMRVSILDRAEAMRVQTNKLIPHGLFDTSTLPLREVDLINDSVLRIHSLELDTIKATGDKIPPKNIRDWDVRSTTIRQWMAVVGIQDFPPGYPPAEASVESQFWRALVHDCIHLRSLEPPYFRRATQEDYYTIRPYLSAIQKGGQMARLPLNLWEMHSTVLVESVIFLTKSGRVGMGPANCQIGDKIHVIPGSRVPYILRPKTAPLLAVDCSTYEDGNVLSQYAVIGDAFLHGIMDGEAIRKSKPEDIRTIDLV